MNGIKPTSLFRIKVWGLLAAVLIGCSPTASPQRNTSDAMGTLEIRGNGEDFVRKGFVSKDGWQIAFDHVWVNLADVTAYQSEPAYHPQTNPSLNSKIQVSLAETTTIDLAKKDTSETILIGDVSAQPGHYNALSWRMTQASKGEAKGYSILMQGTATKAGKTLPFSIGIDQDLGFICGDFVGDERKGFLAAGAQADLEATFHFDHLFGDGTLTPGDELNRDALGFDPLAKLAQQERIEVSLSTLKNQLPPVDYQRLLAILPSLGHVGEGHCHAN